MRIPCPTCGSRSIEEWVHGEVFSVPDHLTDADARDIDREYMHDNTEGVTREAWFHAAGCRRWISLYRDTRTNAFVDPHPS